MSEVALSAQAQKRLAPVLSRFEPSKGDPVTGHVGLHVGLDLLPVPWLAHLVLVQILGCQDIGIGEKTRWQVKFRYDGVEAVLAHQKFGVRLFLDEVGVGDRDGQALAHEAIKKLNALVKAVEQDPLKALAKQKIT